MEFNSEDFELILLKHEHQQYASKLGAINRYAALNLPIISYFLAAITGVVLAFLLLEIF